MTHTNELAAPLDGEELCALQGRLHALLARRAALYSGNGSSSFPTELAQALLEGIYFTLGIRPGDPETLRPLLHTDLEEAHRHGINLIERKICRAKRLWEAARTSLPSMQNRSLTDTLKSIGRCWPRYDYRFFPQEVPCDIDYQLCQSVPETLLGVDYVTEYLKRIVTENDLLRRFEPRRAVSVLQAYCQDYRELLINLAEPVAVNALGCLLAGGDPLEPDVSDGMRANIAEALAPLPGPLRVQVLERAAEELCGFLGISQPHARRYWRSLAAGLVPRLGAALDRGDLSAVFLSAPVL